MTKLERLNAFLNEIDVMGISTDSVDEYDIEAQSLIENFNIDMDLISVSELFSACMYHYFMTDCTINTEQTQKLSEILKSQ